MGRECQASSSLVYGVVIDSPISPCWPLMIERLKEMQKGSLDVATSRTNNSNVDDSFKEPPSKIPKVATSILISNNELNVNDKDGTNDEDNIPYHCQLMDCIEEANYLQEHRDELHKAVKAVFDKVLGIGHDLVLNAYIGHEEDSSTITLILHLEGNDFHSTVDPYIGVCTQQVDTALVDTDGKDTLIQKALDVCGLKAKGPTPAWTMVTTCKFWP